MHYRISHTIGLLMATVLCAGMLNAVIASDLKINGWTLKAQSHISFPTMAAAEKDDETKKQVVQSSVLNDYRNLFWMGLGAIMGGYVIVGFRRLAGWNEAGRYFGVSVISSFACTPFFLHQTDNHPTEQPHVCLFWTFFFALIAWILLELGSIIVTRVNKAATERGLAGVKDELIILFTLGIFGQRVSQAEVNRASVTSTPAATATPPDNK